MRGVEAGFNRFEASFKNNKLLFGQFKARFSGFEATLEKIVGVFWGHFWEVYPRPIGVEKDGQVCCTHHREIFQKKETMHGGLCASLQDAHYLYVSIFVYFLAQLFGIDPAGPDLAMCNFA